MNDPKSSALIKQKGQSLVELALFLPIFLVIIAGVVEISQLVITQNRVTDAARASARFAANGGEDVGLVTVVMNTITQTLETDQGVWDIWSIRATLDPNGTDFTSWQMAHIYGISNTVKAAQFSEAEIRSLVLDEIQLDHEGIRNATNAADLRIVGTYLIHDVESILGLDAVPALKGFNSISELNVVRITGLSVQQSNGCAAFPLAISAGLRSLTAPGSGSNPYPDAGDFEYPTTPPTYSSFVNHSPGVDLPAASEGTVFKTSVGFNYNNGEFGWLKWNSGINNTQDPTTEVTVLSNSLTWPGDSTDYTNHPEDQANGVQAAAGIPYVVRGYAKAASADDQTLHIDDWVIPSVASLTSVPDIKPAVQSNIDQKTDMRVILWETAEPSGSSIYYPGGHYVIKEFAIFRIRGYGNTAGQEWLLLEYIRKDDSCGQN
ncbi:MAG: pilus assembly protein [Anaerolineales bacterium]|nr:pilus assembly protein [Anaerolineales bacterium]